MFILDCTFTLTGLGYGKAQLGVQFRNTESQLAKQGRFEVYDQRCVVNI